MGDGKGNLKGYNAIDEMIYTRTIEDDGRQIDINYNSGIEFHRVETTNNLITETNYDLNGHVSNVKKAYANGDVNTDYYQYDALLEANNIMKKVCYHDNKLVHVIDYYEGKELRIINYEYDGDILRKKVNIEALADEGSSLIISETNNVVESVVDYNYQDVGKINCQKTYIINGKKYVTFNSEDVFVEAYYDDGYDGVRYAFGKDYDNYSHFLLMDKEGNKEYLLDNGSLFLNTDGTFNLTFQNIGGNYYYDDNDNIICTDELGNNYEYDNYGKIIKYQNDKELIEYDYDSSKETQIINNDSHYRIINHVEYDEEDYHHLMSSLIDIGNSAMSAIESSCASVDAALASIKPEPFSGNTDGIRSAAQSQINMITCLNQNINYSLLAYDTCDRKLKDNVDKYIIDNLFDANEANIEKTFISNVNLYLEDRNNDGIFEYKKDTDFKELSEKVIPVYTKTDVNGNTLYFNKERILFNAEGENLEIKYGNNEFNLSFIDNGIVKLTDQNGQPIGIFGDYNNLSCQFGGNQHDLNNYKLLNDENVLSVLEKYYPNSSYEEKLQYLKTAEQKGCGYIAVGNMVFMELEGREEKFMDIFGYPMYNVKYTLNGDITVDYNYEPLALDLFSIINNQNGNVRETVENAIGTTPENVVDIYNYLHHEYGIFDDDYVSVFNKYGFFGDSNYRIYNLDGTTYVDRSMANDSGHAMIKLAEMEDGKWIISTYGEKKLYESHNPYFIQ